MIRADEVGEAGVAPRWRLMRAFVVTILIAGLAGCATSGARQTQSVTGEIREAFRSFEAALNRGDYSAALAFYADDPRFIAYEDGETRYRAYADLAATYAQLPSYGKGVFRYDDLVVRALNADHAYLSTSFWTSFGAKGQPGYFQFEGVMTVVLERFEEGWKMLTIHSSTRKSRGRGGA